MRDINIEKVEVNLNIDIKDLLNVYLMGADTEEEISIAKKCLIEDIIESEIRSNRKKTKTKAYIEEMIKELLC